MDLGSTIFVLKKKTYLIFPISRWACTIPDTETNTVIVTGGGDNTRVSRYGKDGFLEDLPSLTEGRRNHGCGGYFREDGIMVSLTVQF